MFTKIQVDRKIFREAMDNVLPRRRGRLHAGSSGRRTGRAGRKRSRTTIFAFRYADGIMMCGDRKTSGYYYDVVSLKSVKISQVAVQTALLYSGMVSSGELLIRLLREENRSFLEASDFPLSLPGQAQFVTDFCREYYETDPTALEIDVILAGRDWDGSLFIYSISDDGAWMDFSDKFYASGSGVYNARTTLDLLWRPGMAFADALKLAMEAQYQAGMRDSGSSHIAIAIPKIAVINGEGFKFVDDKEVEAARLQVLEGKKESL